MSDWKKCRRKNNKRKKTRLAKKVHKEHGSRSIEGKGRKIRKEKGKRKARVLIGDYCRANKVGNRDMMAKKTVKK